MNENELYFNSFVDNYINGNRTYCKENVDKFNYIDLRSCFVEYAGYSILKATYVMDYLTTGENYQLACDTE